MGLIALDDVKEWLAVTTANDDALLQRLIDAATDFVQTFLNRALAVTAYTETRDGYGTSVLMLANYPIVSVESVTIAGVTVLPSSSYYDGGFLFNDTELMLRRGWFPRERGVVTVSYHAGLAKTPAAITQATCELVGLRYRERDRIGSVSKSIGGETVTFSQKDMSDAIRTLLLQYRKVVPT